MGVPDGDGASNSAATSDRKVGCDRLGSPERVDFLRFQIHTRRLAKCGEFFVRAAREIIPALRS